MAKPGLVRWKHPKIRKKGLKDYEAVKEELEERRRARYVLKEFQVLLKEEALQHGYTQNS